MSFALNVAKDARFTNRNPNARVPAVPQVVSLPFFKSLEERRTAFRARMKADFGLDLEF